METEDIFRTTLSAGALRYGITLDDAALDRFERYTALIRDWNSRINLVSRGDLERFTGYHLLDSLKIACCFDFRNSEKILDFGSGAGLPGIPLALAFPHLSISLVDSRMKRCIFLDEAIRALGLDRVTAHWRRVEDLDQSWNGTFDAVTSRGTVSLETLFRSSSRLIRKGGSLIAIKGDSIDDELRTLFSAVDRSVFHILQTAPPEVPGVRTGRIVLIAKI